MDHDQLKAELAARRDTGAVLRRVRGLRETASRLTGGGLPGSIRGIIEDAFAEPPYSWRTVLGRERSATGGLLKDLTDADWRRAVATLLPHLLLLARDREIRDPSILEWIRLGKGEG